MSTSDYIDALFEQYLDLLDKYTTLRNELNTLQSSVYHHISRANFSVERGIRYGQDFYDERMQASTTLEISASSSDELYSFSLTNEHDAPKQDSVSSIPDHEEAHGDEKLPESLEELNIEETEQDQTSPAEDDGEAEVEESKAKPPKTPLSWFGILTPGAPSLRSAQTASVSTISTIIPQMASLDCEMKELEIRIRRARKFRAKAEAEILRSIKADMASN